MAELASPAPGVQFTTLRWPLEGGSEPTTDDLLFPVVGSTWMLYDDVSANISDVTTAGMTASFRDPIRDSNLHMMRFVCEVVLSFPIAVLGIIGNLLAFIVLCNHKQKLTTTVLLQALAVADTLVLISSILLRCMRYIGLESYNAIFNYVFLSLYPCVYFFRLADTWLTVLLTIDRFIAVCYPLHAQRLCTLRRTYISITVLLASTLLFSTPRFFEYKQMYSGHFIMTSLGVIRSYVIGYQIVLFFLAMYLVPMSLLTALNVCLLRRLRQLNRSQPSIHSDETLIAPSGAPSGRKSHRSVTTIVVTVVIIFLTCNGMTMATHVVYSLQVCFPVFAHLERVRRYMANISNLLVTINCAVNFAIYCLCSGNFRRVLASTFGCAPKPETRISDGPETTLALAPLGESHD